MVCFARSVLARVSEREREATPLTSPSGPSAVPARTRRRGMLLQGVMAGLTTGLISGVLLLILDTLPVFGLINNIQPVIYTPLLVTGVYAVHRAGRRLTRAWQALALGAVAGLV